MAPKRPIENEDDSSSDEEEVSDTHKPRNSDSEEVSRSDEERESLERDDNNNKPSVPSNATSDDVSGSDTDSTDTVPSPTASAFTVKPSNPNPNSAQSILAPKPAEKRGNGRSDQKKVPMTWTEDGEAAVLEGLLEFRRRKGVDPSSNWDVFYLFVKKTIPFDVTKSQVLDKIRRLRKKYEDNALKGGSVSFAKPRDSRLFELSKKVWGGDDNGVKNGKRKVSASVEKEDIERESSLKTAKKSGSVEGLVEKSPKKSLKKARKEESLEEEVKEVVVQNGVSEEGLDGSGFWDSYPRLKMALDNENFGDFSEEVKRAGEADLSRIGHAKAKELEGKWKLYQVKEAELKMMWLDIVREQTKLVIEELAKP